MEQLENDTLAGLWSLRRLDLDRNSISELHKDAFRNLIELRTLQIANNRVQVTRLLPMMYLMFLFIKYCKSLFSSTKITPAD